LLREDPAGPLQLEGPWRLTCLTAGFETLVLVPIKDEGENIGLLQLNGTGKDRVSREDMPFLELVSRHIASAIRHLKDAEALQKRMLYDRVTAGAMAILSGYDNRGEVLKKLIDLLTRRLG
jgi:GAF domain-containing protein